jgi:hypothetical protein
MTHHSRTHCRRPTFRVERALLSQLQWAMVERARCVRHLCRQAPACHACTRSSMTCCAIECDVLCFAVALIVAYAHLKHSLMVLHGSVVTGCGQHATATGYGTAYWTPPLYLYSRHVKKSWECDAVCGGRVTCFHGLAIYAVEPASRA